MARIGPIRAAPGLAISAFQHPVDYLRVIASSMTAPAPWGMSATASTKNGNSVGSRNAMSTGRSPVAAAGPAISVGAVATTRSFIGAALLAIISADGSTMRSVPMSDFRRFGPSCFQAAPSDAS